MAIKQFVPEFVKSFYHRTNWFFRNYGRINKFSELRSNHFYGPITYDSDGLSTSTNADFIKEPRFAKAYAAAEATNPWPGFSLQWRVHVVCWAASQAAQLEGDFVECGVNTGAYARAIVDYIDFASRTKKFYLLDTFAGLVKDQISDKEKKAGIEEYLGSYRNVYDEVKKTFAPFSNVVLIQGMVPDTLPQCQSTKIAYLSIDMNVVAPEIAAANYFWDKLVKGGIVVLDDYGFPQHINQKLAFDDFARQKKVEILALPTGQAIIIKP